MYPSHTSRRGVLNLFLSACMASALLAHGLDAAAQIEWHRLITPQGLSITFEATPSTDHNGGFLDGRRDTHTGGRVGAVLVSALTAAGLQLAQSPRTAGNVTVISPGQAAIESSTGDLSRVTDRWAQKHLERPPTLHLDAGAELYVIVTTDLHFPNSETKNE